MKGINLCIVSMILTLIYILLSILFSNLFFPNASNGSLINSEGTIIGSKLIGQRFKSKLYFHGRPSLYDYKNSISGCSNFPYYSKELLKGTSANYTNHIKINQNTNVDLNLITESASGLDPHITYKGALSQVNRISNASGVDSTKIIMLLEKNAKPLILGLFGEKIVNVLELNIELTNLYAKTSRS